MRSASAEFKRLDEVNKDSRIWEDGKTNGWRKAVKKFVDMSDAWEAKAEELAQALEGLCRQCKCPMFFGYQGKCEHMVPGEFACKDCPVYAGYGALESMKREKEKA